ncbi:MAG: type III restriction system endonuclease [Patescibacteria group bacterium]|nr:MAG: type III restriction system endonuclease [Patescibacteria group bacterium]
MLDGNHLRKIVDYATPTGVFDDVIIAGGVCYFHWDREYDGLCEFVNMYETGPVSSIRDLNKFEILVRHSNAAPIIEKVLSFGYETLDNYVSPRKPFGIPSNYKPRREGVPCWFRRSQGVLYADPQDIVDKTAALHKWKVIAPIFPISGRCRFDRPIRFYRDYDIYIAKPGECCTESWIILRSFDVEDEAVSFRSYIRTKLIRFLILQSVIAQHCSRSYFRFVPDLSPYSGIYTDEMLCEMWNISKEEWSFVDWLVKN